jgi:hypothetical protein
MDRIETGFTINHRIGSNWDYISNKRTEQEAIEYAKQRSEKNHGVLYAVVTGEKNITAIFWNGEQYNRQDT